MTARVVVWTDAGETRKRRHLTSNPARRRLGVVVPVFSTGHQTHHDAVVANRPRYGELLGEITRGMHRKFIASALHYSVNLTTS